MTQTSVIVFNIYDNKKYSKKKDSGFLGMASIAMNVDYIPHSSARNTFFKFLLLYIYINIFYFLFFIFYFLFFFFFLMENAKTNLH